jgi:hypothetical protein
MITLSNNFTSRIPWERGNCIGRPRSTKLIMIISNFDEDEMCLKIKSIHIWLQQTNKDWNTSCHSIEFKCQTLATLKKCGRFTRGGEATWTNPKQR